MDLNVAILILLELTLQYKDEINKAIADYSRNPYFIGINSAIRGNDNKLKVLIYVAILILLELTLQFKRKKKSKN